MVKIRGMSPLARLAQIDDCSRSILESYGLGEMKVSWPKKKLSFIFVKSKVRQ
jgi:hypothetical protein